MDEIDTRTTIPNEKDFDYIGLENIQKGGVNFEQVKGNQQTIKSSSLILKQGFIYYSKLRPYLKKIFYYDSNKVSYGSSELLGLKLNNNADVSFVLNLLLSSYVSRQEQTTSGARMPRMNIQDIKNFKIPLPPLEIQQEIVKYIEAKRDIIKANQKIIQSLQDFISNELKDLIII